MLLESDDLEVNNSRFLACRIKERFVRTYLFRDCILLASVQGSSPFC